ncbi:MAG: hypothetical protein MJY76_01255 [Bacteroidales bacterium]|nr:hypothetical protein [Bacteroidales bacterium]
MLISILALIISIIAAVITWLIYSKQRNDVVLQSFFNDFAMFLASAGRKRNDDAVFLLTKLKIEAGFLDRNLFDEFQNLLPVIEALNLTKSNPNRDHDWEMIMQFLIKFTKAYNPKSKVNSDFLLKNL